MTSRFLAGLDIGTSSIKVAIVEQRNGRPVLRSLIKEPSAGIRKGCVSDLADASPAVAKALGEVKKFSKAALKNVYLNVGTPQVKCQSARGFVPVSRADSEIYEDDMDRAIKASQTSLAIQPNRVVVHNITREFIVDGVGDIMNPVGLSGTRLEVTSLIVDAFEPHIKSLMRLVELSGGTFGGFVLDPLSASRSVLSKRQKDLGVVLVDIGGGTTSMSIYEEGKLLGVQVFPVGAGNITKDLAVGLRIPIEAAEGLKLHYGYAYGGDVNPKETVDIKKFVPDARGAVSRRFIVEIIESRLAEIFEFVHNELKLMGRAGQLPGGVVLVGGGAKLPGITELAKEELRLSSQVGFALRDEWGEETNVFAEHFEDPEFANVLGLALWGADEEGWRKSAGRSLLGMRSLIKYFIP